MSRYLDFPAGLDLLKRWQSGDAQAKAELRRLMDATIAGDHDAAFSKPTPNDRVHTTASVHMLPLAILHDLYGIESAEYYKTDPERYARVNLMISCMMGISKQYTTWAVYAFTCEAIGQTMMYPDKFPPGSDPDEPLMTKETLQSVKTPDFDGIPKVVNDMLRVAQRLSGVAPLLQLSSPYSLAADIYGQEPLLSDVLHDPDFANKLLDHLADVVLTPWIDHFMREFPDGWVELSDASGSPFFIGPDNCKHMAIRSIQRMVKDKPWKDRVFDCNYRGDYVTQAVKKDRSRRRKRAGAETVVQKPTMSLAELTEAKYDVCQSFMIRLEADKIPTDFYEGESITRRIPLTTGVGSCQIDRNSIGDLDNAKENIQAMANEYVTSIKNVCETIGWPDEELLSYPWPSHIYFEDVNGQTQFDLIDIIVREVQENGVFEKHP